MNDFVCDDCKTDLQISNVGLIGNYDDDSCNPFTTLETLCKSCLEKRLKRILRLVGVPEFQIEEYEAIKGHMTQWDLSETVYKQINFYLDAVLRYR